MGEGMGAASVVVLAPHDRADVDPQGASVVTRGAVKHLITIRPGWRVDALDVPVWCGRIVPRARVVAVSSRVTCRACRRAFAKRLRQWNGSR